MEKISNLIGKPVINIYDGIMEGYIKNFYADNKLKKITSFCVFDKDTEEEKIIYAKIIYSYNCDAVMIKNGTQTYPFESVDPIDVNPMGYKIYTSNGKDLGMITDFCFDEKFNIQNWVIDNKTIYNTFSILKVGNNFIVEKDNINQKLFNFGPKKISEIKLIENKTVSIQTEKVNETELPTKILTSGYNFLIGRKVGQNLYAENGLLIAKKQSVITSQIIDAASKNGKLNELTKYSLIA